MITSVTWEGPFSLSLEQCYLDHCAISYCGWPVIKNNFVLILKMEYEE